MADRVEVTPEVARRKLSDGVVPRGPALIAGLLSAPAAPWCAASLAGLAALAVYLRTLAPSIVWGDGAELTTAAYCAGVPHPTGYPLYMLLAHAFLRCCPIGTVAYRMNLLSAFSGALAVALLYPLSLRLTRSRAASLATSLIFAFSSTFWSQAVIAEVYAFQMLVTMAVLSCVLAWDHRGERRWLLASAFVYGLCCTHHGMSALLLPGLLFYALSSRHRAQFLRALPWTVPLCLLPLGLYLYLPLSALHNPPVNWGDPSNWPNFLDHVTGQQYHYLMFDRTPARLEAQIARYIGLGAHDGLLPAQFTPAVVWMAPLGAWSLARRRPRTFVLILLIYLADVLYGLNYDVSDAEVFFLPSHLMIALMIGCGIRQVGLWIRLCLRRTALPQARRPAANTLLALAMLALPLWSLRTNWKPNDEHQDESALRYAHALLATLKPGTMLLGDGDRDYFPLLYAHFVEQQRADVTLVQMCNVLSPGRLRLVTRLSAMGVEVRVPPAYAHAPRHSLRASLLTRLIADNIGRRPIYALWPPELEREPALTAAVAPYYQVAASNLPGAQLMLRPPELASPRLHPRYEQHILFASPRPQGGTDDALEFLGYDYASLPTGELPLWRITYYWRVINPRIARQARVWVLFTDAAGGYRQVESGSPEFHNIHPLAYGVGHRASHLPTVLQETYLLSVPPPEWNKRLFVRIAVQVNSQFLPRRAHPSPWAEIGVMSYDPLKPTLPRVASDYWRPHE